MSKVRIVFGSETGNTESIALMIQDCLKKKGHEVLCESAANVQAKDLAVGYDCVLFGTSIWGTDEIELQGDFEEIANSFDIMGLDGKLSAAFASGDTSFELYCGGVDFIEGQLKAVNANNFIEGLRIEGEASGSQEDVEEWADKVAASL